LKGGIGPLRLLAWNILQGAPKRAGHVAAAILEHDPDVVVLTEYHPERSSSVATALSDAGLPHHASASAGYGYEVFVASSTRLEASAGGHGHDAAIGGYVEVWAPAHELIIAGAYVPVISAVPLSEKRAFWRRLHEAASRNLTRPYVLIGDFNTGDYPMDKEQPGRPFSCTPEYQRMGELGMVEAWRTLNAEIREYSWRSNRGAGFRIDHAFLSPPLRARLAGARYSHREREARISDHSILIIEFARVAA
jgi:exodeoxyribonuclease III